VAGRSLQDEQLPKAAERSVQDVQLPKAAERSLQDEQLPKAVERSVQGVQLPKAAKRSLRDEQLPKAAERSVQGVQLPKAAERSLQDEQLPRRRRRHRANGPSQRPELVSEVFRLCDTDGDGRLSLMEMRTFAEGVGFEGTAEEWVEAYIVLCSANNVDPDRGFSKTMFARLVKDQSGNGVYWTDGELSAVISDLKTKASAPFLAELRVEQLAAAG